MESFIVELVYLTTGALSITWFESMRSFPLIGYTLSFIDIYEKSALIYSVLFFGMSYACGLFLRQIGNVVHSFKGFISRFEKLVKMEANKRMISELEIFKRLEKSSPRFCFSYERARARMIGHAILLGFFSVNLSLVVYGFWCGFLYPGQLVFVTIGFFVSLYFSLKTKYAFYFYANKLLELG